ncbi:MAG: tyrosine--tRNA ligase, partial [Clostridia bacterium]|nr:tyrosine--tRNA ligase [Clostridia bacterium]
ELTKLVHGEEEAEKAKAAAKALFAGGGAAENMPTTTLTGEDFTDGKITVIDMLIKSKLASSKSEARRLVQQGGVFVGDDKVTELDAALDMSAFDTDVIVRKGKKTYHKFTK